MRHATSSRLTSLILPAYNPGAMIDVTLERLDRFRATAAEAWEIILVSDGCTDGSADRMRQWAATHRPGVKVLCLDRNYGKGHAVKAGLLAARGQFRLFADVDLAYDGSEIRRVAQVLWSGAPVAIADRSLPESQLLLPAAMVGPVFLRHVQSLLFRLFVRQMLHLPMGDTQAGLKGLRADVVADVVPLLECQGFAFDCELLTACVQRGWPVACVPVTVRLENRQSTVKLRHIWDMVRSLWAVRHRWLTPTGKTARLMPARPWVRHAA